MSNKDKQKQGPCIAVIFLDWSGLELVSVIMPLPSPLPPKPPASTSYCAPPLQCHRPSTLHPPSAPPNPLHPGLALTFIQENSFSPQSGSRPGVPRVVVLVTDGKSQDDVIPAARSLRESGVEVFAIGGCPKTLTHLTTSSNLPARRSRCEER